jgi:phosphoserine aminotransferase
MTIDRPAMRPANSYFSSGPCRKRPGWSVEALAHASLSRSHRSPEPLSKLKDAIERTKTLLAIPADYKVAIVPGSDTGALEAALWCLLGQRPVDVLAWESFGKDWVKDVVTQLRLPNARTLVADYGLLPDLRAVDFSHDVVFTWNGTTSGVRVPSADFIPSDRQGLTICDATSAVFAQVLDWTKLDVATFSWQKALGGEAAHGMIVLSPRAIERLETFVPERAVPKLFRLAEKGKLVKGLFEGQTINTPSLLCVEDYLDALRWAQDIGGLDALIARADANANALAEWVQRTAWIDYLAVDPVTRSNTSVCLKIVEPALVGQDGGAAAAKLIVSTLESEGVACDIGAYRDAPPGLRVWCGPTVDCGDVAALTLWLDWAYANLKAERARAA